MQKEARRDDNLASSAHQLAHLLIPQWESQAQKEKARCNATLASSAQQLAQLLGECQKLTLYFNKATRGKRPQHHPATLVRLAKQPFQQDQSGPKHALRNPYSPNSQRMEQRTIWKYWESMILTSENNWKRNRTHRSATEKSSSLLQSSSKYLNSILYGIKWKPSSWREANGH